MPIVLVITAFVLALAGTLMIESLSPRFGLVQEPNARSSHTRPTARGGGLAIVLASIAVGFTFAASGYFVSALICAAVIAALGFADDLYDLSPAIRFPVQAVVFSALIGAIGPTPALSLGFGVVISDWMLAASLLLAGLWWVNLFNFMDGIDGLAGSQGVLLLSCGVVVWSTAHNDAANSPMFWFMLVCAAATVGFLVRNWPPARIFMGDVGSNSVALLIFFAALWTISKNVMSYQTWLILGSIFVTDATITLLRRLKRGEKLWLAHRRHAYQQLSRKLGHRRTTLLYAALTLGWAFPLSLVAQRFPGAAWFAVLAAYGPLVILSLANGAGAAAESGESR